MDQIINHNQQIYNRLSENFKNSNRSYYILSRDDLNIITYKDDDVINSFNPRVLNGTFGAVDHPIIELYDETHFIPQSVINFISNGGYFIHAEGDNPYETIYPILKKTGLENIILRTPSISDSFSDIIQEDLLQLYIAIIKMCFVIVSLIVLVIFSSKIYLENHRDKIAVMKLSGYGFFALYKQYLIGLGLSFVVTAFACRLSAYLLIGLAVYLAELAAFYFIANSYTRKSILKILKGG